jgi:hypothetical protein
MTILALVAGASERMVPGLLQQLSSQSLAKMHESADAKSLSDSDD